MSEKLEIIITASDKASKVFGKIGSAAKGLMKNAVKLGAVGLGGVAAGLGTAVGLALDAELSFKKLNQVIESTGGVAGITTWEAQQLADSLAKVTRFSDEQIEAGETLLLTFTGIGEDVFPRATETMLNMAEIMGTDATGSAIQLGKALNDPITGVGALAEVGVSFTEQQKEMITAMVEAGDVAGAQAVILEELEKEFGGVARAAGDTMAGRLAIMKNRLVDVAQEIGLRLIPILGRLMDRYIEPAIKEFSRFAIVFYNVVESLAEGRGMMAETAEALTYLLGVDFETAEVWAERLYDVRDALMALVGIVIRLVPILRNRLIDVAQVIGLLLVPVIQFLAGVIIPVVNAVKDFYDKLSLLFYLAQEFGRNSGTFFGGLSFYFGPETAAKIMKYLNIFFDLKDALVDFIQKHAPAIRAAIIAVGAAFAAVGAVLVGAQVLGAIMSLVSTFALLLNPVFLIIAAIALLAAAWTEDWGGIRTYVTNKVWPALKPILKDLQDFLKVAIPIAITVLKDKWDTVLMPALEGLVSFFNDSIKPALQDLYDWFKVFIPEAWTFLKDKWDTILLPLLGALVDFYNDMVKPILQNLWEFFQVFIPQAIDWLGEKWNTVLMPAFQTLVDFWEFTLMPILSDLIDFFAETIPEAIDVFLEKIGELWESIEGGVLGDVLGAVSGIAGAVGLQMGGVMQGGQVARVNEIGQEGFMSTGPGVVIPHDVFRQLKQSNAANNYNLTVNRNGGGDSLETDFHLMRTLAGA